MAKKRIHEIAKVLRDDHSLEFDSKQLIKELQLLGYDIKSHSSSLEDDLALMAIQKILDKRKPKTASAPVAPKGFVVRRRVGDSLQTTEIAHPPRAPMKASTAGPLPDARPPHVSSDAADGTSPSGDSLPGKHAPAIPAANASELLKAADAAKSLKQVRPLVPTATQAVVVNRPLIPIRRVMPSQPKKTSPDGVRELKPATTPPAPAPRESTDAHAKERERRSTGQRRDKDKKNTAATDIREIMFGRMALPIRGKKRKPTKKGKQTLITEMAEEKKIIKVEEGITVSDLSQRMGIKTAEIIRKLMQDGKMVTTNQIIDVDTAAIIATDYGWSVKKVGFEVEDFLPKIAGATEASVVCPPVVTVMGHVDHGKTSLLDAIRQENVVAGEAGGITQHIGAYTVKSSQGEVTFLDTPGHEAFSAMRARGANITDVVVLVVAANDGVMPQTKEAIHHAQQAKAPIVVAINKMDLPATNVDRVKKELADVGLLPEDWGGETIMVPVSAKTRQGIDLLLENISLQAEVLQLTANPDRPAVATVLEARLEKGRGPVATVLVQEGTLKKGDAIVSGISYGRVRMMMSDRGKLIDEVKPGYSAEVIGMSAVPIAGDGVNSVADEKAAKQISDHRMLKLRQVEATKTSRETLDDLLARQMTAEQKELKIVLKADVSGSLEAVAEAIKKLSTPKVKATIVQKGVGMMTETDIGNAEAFGAIVLGFNSRPESGAETAAKQKGVHWATYGVIYGLLDAVTAHMENLLEPVRVEKKLGRAEVRNIFNVPKLGVVAGSAVTEGVVKRSAQARVWRSNAQLFEGKVTSLKRFKDDVREVIQGYECGIGFEGFHAMEPGDVVEVYEIEETRQALN